MTKVAVIQESPVLLDRNKTLEKAIQLIQQATSSGAELVVFPEAYISGYPAWIWRLRPGSNWGINDELHARLLDSGDEWLGTMKHIAREGRCWVVCSGVALTNSDIPADFPERDNLYPDSEEWINPGDSAVIAPGGEIVAGPMRREKGILFADVDNRRASLAKRDLDITGHYSRPDIFTFSVNTQAQSPINFK